MRLLHRFIVVSLIIALLISVNINVCAINTGFSTDELTEDEKNTFFSNICISALNKEPPKQAIDCFDVNPNGKIAVGYSDSENKIICVYSQRNFLYGYEFFDEGDFGVEWDGDNINIYFVRSNLIVSVTPQGEITGVLKVQNTIENNTYHNYVLHSTERILGDSKYKLQNNMGILNVFASSFSQLVVTTSLEEDFIVYDVNSTYLIKILCWCIGITIFVVLVVYVIIRQFVKIKKAIRKNTGDGSVC